MTFLRFYIVFGMCSIRGTEQRQFPVPILCPTLPPCRVLCPFTLVLDRQRVEKQNRHHRLFGPPNWRAVMGQQLITKKI